MKVLFVCLDNYPYNGACTSLLKNMFHSGNMKSQLDEIHILTIGKSPGASLDKEQHDGITIHRCYPLTGLSKIELLQLLGKKPLFTLGGIAAKSWYSFKKKLCRTKSLTNANHTKTLLKKLKLLEQEAFDVIIPVCGHYEAGEAVLAHCKHSRAKLLVYQVDPCADNYAFSSEQSKCALLLEQSLFEAASGIITTPILYSNILSRYPASISKKLYSMEFPNVAPSLEGALPKSSPEYRCVYAGSIYPSARNPEYTMKVFNLIQDPSIKLHFVGTEKHQIYEYIKKDAVGDRFVFHGRLPLTEAKLQIGKGEILVNIGNIMVNQVPSKLFEYISACKPIINICTNPDCPSLAYLEKYPLSLSIVEGAGTPEEHAKQIEAFIHKYSGQTVAPDLVLERFLTCTPDYCAQQMVDVIYGCFKEERDIT